MLLENRHFDTAAIRTFEEVKGKNVKVLKGVAVHATCESAIELVQS